MIPRYTPKEFERLWSDETRFETWLNVELAACSSMEEAGIVPMGTVDRIRDRKIELDPSRIGEIEVLTRHDVIAFLTHVEELVGPDARWLHFGMTSSDVLDTATALLVSKAIDLLVVRLNRVIDSLANRVIQHRSTVVVGRSHGIHAEPLCFGVVLAGHLSEFKRCRRRLVRAREEIAVGKLSGAVGSHVHLSPSIEARTMERLGLRAETVSTQVVARDRHAVVFSTFAVVAAAVERFATNMRHWQRTEVGEVEELFTVGQKGSSAMPHKRNPILSENLCGLARTVRAAVVPALENVVLWHERDISHSSVERMILPDVTSTLGFMLDRLAGLVEGFVVDKDRMVRNITTTDQRIFSEAVLLELIRGGMSRGEAYSIVQSAAMRSMEGKESFKEILEKDEKVHCRVVGSDLDRCFDIDHSLRWSDIIINRALDEA